MGFKRLILTVASILGLLIISKTERFTNWLDRFILNPPLGDQWDHQGIEERREYRFGNLYAMCQYTKKTIAANTKKNKEDVVLLPPNEYMRSIKLGDLFPMPEPIIFYYHSNIKAVWTTSPDVMKANWTFVPSANGSLSLIPLTHDELLKILETYKKFKTI